MRRKYFMRGMGVGIVITTLVFTLSSFVRGTTMSRAEIIKKAEEYGMVMQDGQTLTETDSSKTTSDSTSKEPKVEVETITGSDVTEPPKETSENKTTSDNKSQTKVDNTSSSENIIDFSIKSGENSAVISANLYKAGLIENPTKFDKYLESNGYDKYLKVGSYSIREGSSEETIAKTLTGR